MATLSAPATPSLNGALIDPTKQAEYPILLGEKLAKNDSAQDDRLINITYNYKSKAASPHQKATITSVNSSPHIFKLAIQDKARNAEQTNLTYTYHGSVDPASRISESETSNLVLVFDQKRKAFILEPVSTLLNFNLRSAPGKTSRQVIEQYPQLSVLADEDQVSGDDRLQSGGSEDDAIGAADESNPYDYRHFLPKAKAEGDNLAGELSSNSTPDPHHVVSKPTRDHLTPSMAAAARPRAPPAARPKQKTNPLRPPKRQTKATTADSGKTTKSKPKSAEVVDPEDLASESSPSDDEAKASRKEKSKPEQPPTSPGGNIIVDGDLIIDMGSPPPTRPKFNINPRHFSSNNTSSNEADYDSDDEEDIEDLRLPPPAGATGQHSATDTGGAQEADRQGDEQADTEMVDDDDLAAEMEAAFEESAREEEQERARNQQQMYQQQQIESDESEVSEEE